MQQVSHSQRMSLFFRHFPISQDSVHASQDAVSPPSTGSATPLTKTASSEAR
jgi:hypothetical protein